MSEKADQQHPVQGQESVRLDKWLKVARIFRTRAQAAKSCEEGKVKVNGQVAKPAKAIRAGDTVTVKHKHLYRTFDVLQVTAKSLSAEKARELYREHQQELSPESQELLELYQRARRVRPPFKGRPTKKERRRLERLRGW
ncbi:MAG: RNA-binding S4 domain-containing protein [bacterium]|nr:RNA-binding S4 domain-containing protein [candidate division KSB1 bacterium]MDH7560755.1 RNA-binding S4 domain-containing protein [bacterium]